MGEVPIGAVVVLNGKIIASAHNLCESLKDPTAHAEVSAIRAACLALGTFSLQGCVLYTSCEPCPMCLAAIYWAHIDAVYYGADKDDAANAGFDDSFIYKEFVLPRNERSKPLGELLPDEAQIPFEKWKNKSDKQTY